MKKFSFLLVVLTLLLATPGFADVIFDLGNNPQPYEQNILFTSDQTGALVTGFTNQTNTLVNFSSANDILVVTAVGQANLTASDGLINDVTITVPGFTYLDMILNPSGVGTGGSTTMATVTVVTNDGTFSTNLALSGAESQNFLTILAAGGETILSTTITSAAGFDELRQVRISGVEEGGPGPAPIPEPTTLLLLGSGLVGLVAWRRKK